MNRGKSAAEDAHSPFKRPENFVKFLRREPNEFRKKMLFIGYMFDRLAQKGVISYLVGGQAVELYTAGQFVTGDMDITVSNRKIPEVLLERLGFEKLGMVWLSEEIGIAVQIVASYPSRVEKARTFNVEGYVVNVVGVEDLIVDRLAAAKYWRSNPKQDIEQATVLYDIFRNNIDLQYLNKRGLEEKVGDYLKEIARFSRNGIRKTSLNRSMNKSRIER